MTNQTAPALLGLGTPIANLDDYKQFIDNLYFLLHEGSGSRLNENPPPFEDIKLPDYA